MVVAWLFVLTALVLSCWGVRRVQSNGATAFEQDEAIGAIVGSWLLVASASVIVFSTVHGWIAALSISLIVLARWATPRIYIWWANLPPDVDPPLQYAASQAFRQRRQQRKH